MMQRVRILLLICIGLISVVPNALPAGKKKALQKQTQNQTQHLPEYVPGVVMLKFRDGLNFGEYIIRTGIPEVDAELARIGATQIRSVLPRTQTSSLNGIAQIAGIYTVRFAATEDVLVISERLSKYNDILYAEPKKLYQLKETPNDPLYSSMPQFNQVRASQAWDHVKGENDSIVIAVVDGGTDWDHADLLNNIWNNTDEVPANGVDDDGNGFIDDIHGWNFANHSNDPTGLPGTPLSGRHGTHVAGIAGGVTDNGLGISSISWNAQLMPINTASPIFDNAVAYGFEGICYAAANGADIINCSWGGLGAPSSFEQDIIDFAYANNAIVIAAAGNGGYDSVGDNNDLFPFYPASYHGVVGVGATYKTHDQKAVFSNYGASVDVFAPGIAILSTFPNSVYSDNYTGTSMSTAMVSGLAALVKTRRPWYNYQQVREQIRASADNIDAANSSQFSELLGKGRINAERAVSDFTLPSIRIKSYHFDEPGGNGVINAGEEIDLTVEVTNYLADAGSPNFELLPFTGNVTMNMATASLTSLDSAAVADVDFRFTVDNGLGDGTMLCFYLDITDGAYHDRDIIRLTVNPPRLANHHTSSLLATITSEANLGFISFAGESEGDGFVHTGFNYLYEGGLLIGAGPSQVSDCVRGSNQSVQDTDFRLATGAEIVMVSPGQYTSQEASVLLVDSTATQPIGLSVLQESFADDRPGHMDFLMLRYTIQNNNAMPLNNIYAGLYFDWDINFDIDDYGRYDSSRKMGYVMDAPTPSKIAAVKLLSDVGDVHYRAIHNPDELYDGFTTSEKWSFLSNGIQTQSLNAVDISSMLSAGPLDIPAGGSVMIAFAVIGANSINELTASADSAQAFWDNPTSVHPAGDQPVRQFELAQNYPNPFNPSTTIEFELPVASRVALDVYDVVGQRVVRAFRETPLRSGTHIWEWDATDVTGKPVASGIYFYRLKTANYTQTRKMILIR